MPLSSAVLERLQEAITTSPGPLDRSRWDPEALALLARLPAGYRSFLEAYADGGAVREGALVFATGVPYRTPEIDNPSRTDLVRDFLPFGELTGNLEVVPSWGVSIAKCSQDSLVVLSLRPEDHGSVWYWDWHWYYPWSKFFFDDRLDAVHDRYPESETILENPGHPMFATVRDAINEATLVRIADSFEAWIAACRDENEEPEHDE